MPRSTTILHVAVTLLSFCAVGVRCQDRMCYALDGTTYPHDIPCTNDEVTTCCNEKDICMSNGLCYLQSTHGSVLSRGSCTDRNWGPRCFAPCCKYIYPLFFCFFVCFFLLFLNYIHGYRPFATCSILLSMVAFPTQFISRLY